MSWGQGKTRGWDEGVQSKASYPEDRLKESKEQALLLLLFLDQAGVGQTNCKSKGVGPGRVGMNPKCEPSSVFPYGPHPNNQIAPPSTEALTCALRDSLHVAFWNLLSRWESDFEDVRLLQDPDPFCLSVLFFSVPTQLETQFPIVSVFSPIVG